MKQNGSCRMITSSMGASHLSKSRRARRRVGSGNRHDMPEPVILLWSCRERGHSSPQLQSQLVLRRRLIHLPHRTKGAGSGFHTHGSMKAHGTERFSVQVVKLHAPYRSRPRHRPSPPPLLPPLRARPLLPILLVIPFLSTYPRGPLRT